MRCKAPAAAMMTFLAIVPGRVCADETSREKAVRSASSIAAVVIGVGAGLFGAYWAVMPGDAVIADGTPALVAAAAVVPSSAVFALSAWAGTRLFTEIMLGLKTHPLVSLPIGTVLGALGGAITGAAGFSVLFAIACPLGIATVGDMEWAESVGMALLAGGFWGALTGALPGAVGGPLISIAAGYR